MVSSLSNPNVFPADWSASLPSATFSGSSFSFLSLLPEDKSLFNSLKLSTISLDIFSVSLESSVFWTSGENPLPVLSSTPIPC